MTSKSSKKPKPGTKDKVAFQLKTKHAGKEKIKQNGTDKKKLKEESHTKKSESKASSQPKPSGAPQQKSKTTPAQNSTSVSSWLTTSLCLFVVVVGIAIAAYHFREEIDKILHSEIVSRDIRNKDSDVSPLETFSRNNQIDEDNGSDDELEMTDFDNLELKDLNIDKTNVEAKKEEPNAKDTPTTEINKEVKKEEPKVEAKKEEPKVEAKKEEPKVEAKKEEPKVEAKKEEPKVEAKKEEPKVEAKKEEPKVEAKKEEPKVEAKKEEPKVEPKKEEPKVEAKKEEPKVEAKKEDPRVEVKKEASKSDIRKQYKFSSITNDEDFKIRDELDEADSLFNEDKYEESIRKYDLIIRAHITSPRAYYGKGLTLDKLGFKHMSNEFLERAIDFLARVLDLENVPDELYKMAGRKLADRQQFRGWGGDAIKTFKKLSERFPDDLSLKNEYGVSYMMVGQNDKARAVFQEVLAKHPNSGFAKVHLGFILKAKDNKLEEAVQLLSEGIESQEPGTIDGRFFLHLGDSLIRLGREAEARKYFEEGEKKGLFLSAWQRSLYNVKGLTGRPWWTVEQTGYQKYLNLLKENWKTIRDEGLAQLDPATGSFLPEEENLRETGDWKQFTLYQQGRKNAKNCEKAPKTCALIDQIPDAKGCKRGQVKFSVMSPGIHVWPHVGPTNCRIRAHLGLVVPEGPTIRIVNDTRSWKEGQFIIFDDSFEHEVWHKGNATRLVLIVDFWHPELTEAQKRGLSAI